ncbi:MAG TPA: phospholipase D family protein [Candidatus Binatia bacterium]|jgi:putative cardiolipin synthase
MAPVRYPPLYLALALLLAACSATVNWDYPRVASSAFAHPETTSVGALFQEAADKHPGLSGFSVVQFGENAFLARLAMIDLAEKSIDAQYYIWDADTTGRILADRLLRAADRGVHVRLLLDDIYQTSEKDSVIALMDAHPNVEVRVFNPVENRRWRRLSFVGDFSRANHRMHNKLLVVDNAIGIVGGRNIADIYFGVSQDHNYRDLDVLAAGPVVRDLSASFDTFWNSDSGVPVGAVVKELPTEMDLQAGRERLQKNIAAAATPYPMYKNVDELRAHLKEIRDNFIWAPGRVLVENPSRVTTAVARGVISKALSERVSEVQHEILIESPYFVLPEPVIERLGQLTARGVRVRALTNSAASNDVIAAHAFYAHTREKLLKAGVELYELRPDTNMEKHWSVLSGKSRAALHCKAIVFDRKSVFIGSFNLDPRSSTLNTEIGVMIDSPEIAGRVAKIMDEGVAPGSAFHVTLDGDDSLLWAAENNGEKVQYHKDPDTNAWHRFLFGVVGILPIEDLT